mmetsp:Transcript_48890/g.54684  ORF Transcript_48890/g.54684 Transcript_48890/m.54684 type:complete len:84 (-) Transcript_48890:315-566(-)
MISFISGVVVVVANVALYWNSNRSKSTTTNWTVTDVNNERMKIKMKTKRKRKFIRRNRMNLKEIVGVVIFVNNLFNIETSVLL